MGGLLYAELCSEEREDSVFFKDNMGLECGSTAENLPSMLKALGSRPSFRKQQQSYPQTTIVGEEAVVMPKRPSCGLSGEITDGQEGG